MATPPVFLPKKSHGQRSLAGYSPWSGKRVGYNLAAKQQPINNVVIVLGEQQRDSPIHVHVSIITQTPLCSRLPHNTEQSSSCYTAGPHWLSILNIEVCIYPS